MALVVLLVACSSAETPVHPGEPRASPPSSDPTYALADVTRDLALEMHRASLAPFEDHRDPRVVVELVNRSVDRAYAVVLPNDGSDAGWREPRVWFTFEGKTSSGGWESPSPERGLRCGRYAVDWQADVRILKPRERLTLPWFDFGNRYELADDTVRVRIVAHYAYGEVASTLDRSKVPPSLWPMPRYALASASLEIDVARPLALELRVRGAVPTGPSAPLASAVDVVLTNRSAVPRAFSLPDDGASLYIEAEVDGPRGRRIVPVGSAGLVAHAADDQIAPGQSRSLVTSGLKTGYGWGLDGERVRRLRAVYMQTFREGETVRGRAVNHGEEHNATDARHGRHHNSRRVTSPWIDVP